MTNTGNFAGFDKKAFFKGFGAAEPQDAPPPAAQAPVEPAPAAAPPQPVAVAPAAPPTMDVPLPAQVAPAAPAPVPTAQASPPAAPAVSLSPVEVPPTPTAQTPPAQITPAQTPPAQTPPETLTPTETLHPADPPVQDALPAEIALAAPHEVDELEPDLEEGDEPEDGDLTLPSAESLGEPSGQLFGHLAALLTPGSALAFSVAKGEEGKLTVRIQPINLPDISDLTLTGQPEEFDTGDFLASLRLYRANISEGLLAQTQKQLAAKSGGKAATVTPAPKPSDRLLGTLSLAVDVPNATIKAVRNGSDVAVTSGDNRVNEGKYTVEVSAEGYKPQKKSVKVERNKTVSLDFTLGGALELQGAEGATVVITGPDEQVVQPGRGLKEGMYHVVADQEGKKQFTWHGSVKSGGTVTVAVKFDAAPPGLF
ncbi:hypothetical protein Dxin01_00804 [Deinococcus xinjiangensis]|uniref:PEGA domain-containing protein n=1 Tax=Deinococcus xinjiangensis TaxID=457454 RepID=A0ABP9V715_9DEIO